MCCSAGQSARAVVAAAAAAKRCKLFLDRLAACISAENYARALRNAKHTQTLTFNSIHIV